MDLLPNVSIWVAALAGALLYGLRYALFAAVAHVAVRRRPGDGPHNARTIGQRGAQVRRELFNSAWTVAVFAGVIAVMHGFGLLAHTQLYWSIGDRPLWWFPASIVCMLVLHDTLFYWMHRAIHMPQLFRQVHLEHHRSVQPTAFAAYSFHPWEALGEASIVTLILFLLPIHPVAFLIFQSISTAYNVYGHCGRELYPAAMRDHWLGRWINTSTLHADHHRRGRGNYSLYFTVWDRWMGTVLPESGDRGTSAEGHPAVKRPSGSST